MNKKWLALGLSLVCMVGSVFAQNSKQMVDKLKKDYPNLNVEEATFVPEIKLYELRLKGTQALSYTNENVDFFLIAGELVDPKSKKNMTQEREMANVQRFYKNLPFDKAITVKYGKGTRHIAIFTDPDCPFCKNVDREIHSKLTKDDITIHYFMNPLNIPGHEQAPLKAAKIWCSSNRGQAWIDWMVKGQLPNNDGTCKNPVAETKQIATEVGFNSTPTIIFDNGYIVRQQLTGEQIRELLSKRKP